VPFFAAIAIAGCGGKEEAPDTLSHHELIARGDALCREAARRLPPLPQQNQSQIVLRWLTEVDRISTEIIRRFNELQPPDEHVEAYAFFVTSIERRLNDFREARMALQNRNRQGFLDALLKAQTTHARQSTQAAKRLGFKVCGQN
jgi:hypothetical protein